jgi:hypothetical protein
MIDDMLVFGVSLEVAQSARSCRLLIKGGRGGTGELPKFNLGARRARRILLPLAREGMRAARLDEGP